MAFERVVSEFVSAARRAGLQISTAETLDAVRALAEVGLSNRDVARSALASTLVKRKDDRDTFRAVFDTFFGDPVRSTEDEGHLAQLLRGLQLSSTEVEAVIEVLHAMSSTLAGAGLSSLLSGPSAWDMRAENAVRALNLEERLSEGQLGYHAARLFERSGGRSMRRAVDVLHQELTSRLGAQADRVRALLLVELERYRRAMRAHLDRRVEVAEPSAIRVAPVERRAVAGLALADRLELTKALRRLAEKLNGAESVRRRRGARGRLDVRKTLRRAFSTGGVPFRLEHRKRTRRNGKLFLVCDVSESVRPSSELLLFVVREVQVHARAARAFVFVNRAVEVTDAFVRSGNDQDWQQLCITADVDLHANSNYGRLFEQLVERDRKEFGPSDTVLILGDGRSNFHASRADLLAKLGRRVRRIYWLNPEPRSRWGAGDSRMDQYLPHCHRVYAVPDGRSLFVAAQKLVRERF